MKVTNYVWSLAILALLSYAPQRAQAQQKIADATDIALDNCVAEKLATGDFFFGAKGQPNDRVLFTLDEQLSAQQVLAACQSQKDAWLQWCEPLARQKVGVFAPDQQGPSNCTTYSSYITESVVREAFGHQNNLKAWLAARLEPSGPQYAQAPPQIATPQPSPLPAGEQKIGDATDAALGDCVDQKVASGNFFTVSLKRRPPSYLETLDLDLLISAEKIMVACQPQAAAWDNVCEKESGHVVGPTSCTQEMMYITEGIVRDGWNHRDNLNAWLQRGKPSTPKAQR